MKTLDNDIRKLEDLDDGSSVYEIGETPNEVREVSFNENLAEKISDEALKRLSTYLIEQIEKDVEASKPWFDSIKRAKEVLGFDIEEVKYQPFPHATKTYDTTLGNSLIRFYATTRTELLPPAGPVGYRIAGPTNEVLENKGEKVRNWLNYYLTIVDKAYYSDFERFLIHLGFNGSAFKKVYYDNLLKRPISRFIISDDFIIDGECTSILDSSRLTHVLHLSKREILLKQEKGLYRNIELSIFKSASEMADPISKENIFDKEDFDKNVYEHPSLFSIYECHVYVSLEDFENNGIKENNDSFPLPYIITLEPKSKEILSIRRNWEEDDSNKERINYFIQYNYLPGFGVRGLGLAHLLGSNAISLTTMLRELIDAGKFKNLPGGLRQKGIKQQENDLIVGPGQFVEVNTGGIPLAEAFMPLPYADPCRTLLDLMGLVQNNTKELGSTSELGMLTSREDIPTGTMLAGLEENNKIQSSVLKSIHYSLTQELQLIDKLFRKSMDMNFSEEVNGEFISANDFVEEVEIIPISDPSVNSTVQRILKAQATLQLATQAPDLHNMREVFKLNYKAQGMDEDDIEKILKPDPATLEAEIIPLDPISENINALKGQPIKAAIWQEHAAHKLAHGLFAQENPDIAPIMMAHIKEHDAYAYLLEMQQLLGAQLPPVEMIQNPEVQNSIALAIAERLEEKGIEEASNQGAPIDPNALIMADIKQKEAETISREKIANLKAETDIFKAQLDFEKEKAKIESAEDIAQLKTQTELFKEGIIHE